MWPRYFLGRMYRPTPYPVYLPASEPGEVATLSTVPTVTPNLETLREEVLRRLGDAAGTVWATDEIDAYLKRGYLELAAAGRVFWDHYYAENVPAGFSSESLWEAEYESYSYGIANYTCVDEKRLEDETHRIGWANHTCPDEWRDGWLDDATASAAIPATTELPETVLELERSVWDHMAIAALSPAHLAKLDTRFKITEGEVFGFTWRQDGVRTYRKIRVPATAADSYETVGQWGILRSPTDISSETTSGSWGSPRRIPTQHPMGANYWGLPRRVYADKTNVRIEHWRPGRPLDDRDGGELPDYYARYLRDYAQWRALSRSGPGQDAKLAEHYQARWARALARLDDRRRHLNANRVGGFQRAASVLGKQRPPRPKLPWAYGKELR